MQIARRKVHESATKSFYFLAHFAAPAAALAAAANDAKWLSWGWKYFFGRHTKKGTIIFLYASM